MKSFYRWVNDHAGLCRGIVLLAMAAFIFYAATLEHVSLLTVYFIGLIVLFIFNRFLSVAAGKVMEEPFALCDQECDPYPLLDALRQIVAKNQNSPQQQSAQINYAQALRLVGENYKCADILAQINIDRYPATNIYTKFIYYNSLADVLFALERDPEAHIWHRKAMQIYTDMPQNKLKQQLEPDVQLSAAGALYRAGDHITALQKVAWIKCKGKRQLLDAALLAAKCHLALEEPEKAKEKLQYVADNGNKLHIAEEARVLLETLS